MKKILIFISLIFLSFFYSVKASPVISNITIDPANPWIEEDVFISFECFDENHTIEEVKVSLAKNNSTLRVKSFFPSENATYQFYHSFLAPGEYSITFYCKNNVSNSTTEVRNFNVSQLTSSVNVSSPTYVGDNVVKIYVLIKKDAIILDECSSINFTVLLDEEKVEWKGGTDFIPGGGCLLEIDTPPEGSYEVKVKSSYEDAETLVTSTLQVKEPLQFELIDIDKTWIKANENVTLTLKALYRDKPFELKDEYITVTIDSVACSIVEISQSDEYSYVIISSPNLSPGTYDLSIKLNYMGFSKNASSEISYVVPVSGSLKGSDNKPISAQIKFKSNETEKTIVTNSQGSYSGYIPPGFYDIEFDFPNSKLILSGVLVNQFDDPIRFDHPSAAVEIPGIGVGDIFVYEVALSYSNAYLEMKYDDSKILDEGRIRIYKCEDWNFGRKICNGKWNPVSAQIDTVRNLIKLNTTLSAFVIGYEKNLVLNFDSDKDEYYLKEIIKITGITEDEDSKPVKDVKVTASILNTKISASTQSDKSGVFSLEMQAPDKEGEYTILIKAEKSPFSPVNGTKSINVLRSEELSLVVPESIKIKQGETSSLWISVINTGQTDFSDISLTLSGIPEGYYTLPKINELKAGDEKKVSIDFTIPENASKTSHTGKLKVIYDDSFIEKEFILTILSAENKTSESQKGFKFPSLTLPTGKFVLPTFETNHLIVIILVAISSFSLSFFLKKRKVSTEVEREDIKNLLLDIRREIEREREKSQKGKTRKKRIKKTSKQ